MRSRKFLCLSAAMAICLLSLASCDLTLGPKTKTVYTIVFPGKPLEILESVKVKGRLLDGSGDAVTQDAGGWVVMPKEHWDAVKRALDTKTKE